MRAWNSGAQPGVKGLCPLNAFWGQLVKRVEKTALYHIVIWISMDCCWSVYRTRENLQGTVTICSPYPKFILTVVISFENPFKTQHCVQITGNSY